MAGTLKLGLNTGYWAGGPPPGAAESVAEAERLGFDSIWTAEAYGSDCLTPLAWWGAKTERIKLGTAIVQMSARQPAATAMAAMTMDHLSGGRFILGLGVSGPQVVEGWYGMPFAKPLARTREDIAIYLGAEGPKNIALCAELCDGWLAMLFSPVHQDIYRPALQEGFSRPGARRTPQEFEVAATVPFIVSDDVEGAVDALRPFYALYLGGMGAKGVNFHANVAIRMGYEREVGEIQDLYLAGRKDEAFAKVPRQLIEELSLIGPPEKIRDDLAKWRESIVTTLLVSGDRATLRTIAELVLG